MIHIKTRFLFFIIILTFCYHPVSSQTYTTLKGHISFSSQAAEENIEAHNYNVAVQLLVQPGKGQFIIPIKSFRFKKALMEEHFNENYMESDVYPKATYKYEIVNIEKVIINKPGVYSVVTRGIITIKGTSKNIEIPGSIVVVDANYIRLEAEFSLHPADYGIQVPRLLENKIAKSIDVKISTALNKH